MPNSLAVARGGSKRSKQTANKAIDRGNASSGMLEGKGDQEGRAQHRHYAHLPMRGMMGATPAVEIVMRFCAMCRQRHRQQRGPGIVEKGVITQPSAGAGSTHRRDCA